jgi:Stealth protein CR2, conserved region 2/Stealth protein CR1, conserved region 1
MFDVDVVITWVDGADPALALKRNHYLSNATTPLHDNGTNPHRWVCSDELSFCLRSIANNAPWVRRIWIVTDNQIPDVEGLSHGVTEKITIVDHREIFAGYEDALPTFNSLAIETMLWRIPDLADHFLYFNDDVFLTARVEPADFFDERGPVLRGKWMNYGHLPQCEESRDEAALLNQFNEINAAAMMKYSADHIFDSAHVVHPMQRSVMAALYEKHRADFVRNAAFRFRCTEQFLPQSLYNHACLAAGAATVQSTRDYVHVGVGMIEQWSPAAVHAFLAREDRKAIKFLCVNDLPGVERRYPEARLWIEEAISGANESR